MYEPAECFGENKIADYTEHQKSAGASLSLQNDVLCNRLWKSKSGSASSCPRQQNQMRGGTDRYLFGEPNTVGQAQQLLNMVEQFIQLFM